MASDDGKITEGEPTSLEGALDQLRDFKARLSHAQAKLKLYGDGSGGSFSRSFLKIPRTVMEGMDPLLWVDLEGRVVEVNQKMSVLLYEDRGSVPPPSSLRGKALEEVDQLPWAPGILRTLLVDARDQLLPVQFSVQAGDPSGQVRHFVFHAEATAKGGHFRVEDATARTRIEDYFSRYVGAEVLEMLKDRSEADFFRTSRRNMTVLFADLRGFTRASSTLSPEQVCEFINEFLEAMIEVVDRNRATVDKIVGDEVMVLCGAPCPLEDHAAQALKVAIGMIEAQDELIERWRRRALPELSNLHVGIGINTGEMVVGNIGSRLRTQYTVLGSSVNLAARLCSSARSGEILMSRQTFEVVRKVIQGQPDYFDPPLKGFREHDPVEAKGFSEPIPVVTYIHRTRD